MSRVLLLDGKPFPEDALLAGASSPGLRYGEGLFETMKMENGRVALFDYHMERLRDGMKALGLGAPPLLADEIADCCARNGDTASARVRVMVYRDEGTRRVIQSWPLEPASQDCLDIGVFPHGRKAIDAYANLKTNNYLLYREAARWAKDNNLGECLVLNTDGRVADGSIANVFWVKDGTIYTPPLSEGGIAGVMRRHFMATRPVTERATEAEELKAADEIFFTNAIRGIRWVQRFGDKTFSDTICRKL